MPNMSNDEVRQCMVFAEAGGYYEKAYLCEEVLRLRAALDKALAQLPDGMKLCTIRFKSCHIGHGRLTADNWIDNGCHWCELEKVRANLAAARSEIARRDQRGGDDACSMHDSTA